MKINQYKPVILSEVSPDDILLGDESPKGTTRTFPIGVLTEYFSEQILGGGSITQTYTVTQPNIGISLIIGDLICIYQGAFTKANATDAEKPAVGMVTSIVDNNTIVFQRGGVLPYAKSVLVKGSQYFLSTVSGDPVEASPSDYIQPVFIALETNIIWLNIEPLFTSSATTPTDKGSIVRLPSGGATTSEVEATITVGNVTAGTIFPIGTTLDQFMTALLSPVIQPTKTNNSLSLSGITTTTLEVGTAYMAQLVSNYNTGTIQSKNGAPDVPLTGAATIATFGGAGANAGTGAVAVNLSLGANQWSVVQNYGNEAAPYYDSNGTPSTIFDADRGPGSLAANSNIVTAKYRYWFSIGSIPTTSAGVRALPNTAFYPVAQFDIVIPANTPQVAFYLPDTVSNVQVLYVESSFANVTGSFGVNNMIVEDARPSPVGYLRFETIIGGGGYPAQATYRVVITA